MRALLVAVSSYPTLDKAYQLQGPRNDVQRMRQVLLQRGFKPDQIQLLADGVSGAQEPTRDNILKALDAMGRGAQAGDTVVLYFAGHGSQEPADRSTPAGRQEADGLFEIFLPIDVGRWDGQLGRVKNAIADHEMRDKVDRIQGRGAFVWGLFDTCHSATMVRGGPDAEVRFRHVDQRALGIDEKVLEAASSDAARTRGGPAPSPASAAAVGALDAPAAAPRPGTGGSAFFYAAQTTELAPELRLPQGDPDRQPYGLFSFMITRALEMNQPMTYRQLGQYVLSQYGGIAEAHVTPLFSGTALDQTVLGQQTLPVRQWPVSANKLTVPTGSLSGLAEGAIFALLPNALSKVEDAIGYLRARKVDIAQTELEPVALQNKPAPAAADFAAGVQARLVSNPERFSLHVAVDARDCKAPCAWMPPINQLRANGVPGADIRWVAGAADVLLKLKPDGVLALSPSEQGEVECGNGKPCPGLRRGTYVLVPPAPGAATTEAAANQVAQTLHAIARSTNLLRLASRLSMASLGQGLKVSLAVQPKGQGARQPITPESVPALAPGDLVSVKLENQGTRPVDVTLLYADARFGIGAMFPDRAAGEVNRLEPGAVKAIEDITISDADGVFGIERLLVISVQAQPHAERADFSFLAQPALKDAERSATRGGPLPDDLQAFMDAGFADYRTRGTPARMPSSQTGMQVFTFNVKPAKP